MHSFTAPFAFDRLWAPFLFDLKSTGFDSSFWSIDNSTLETRPRVIGITGRISKSDAKRMGIVFKNTEQIVTDIGGMKIRDRYIENKNHLCGGRVNSIGRFDLMETSSVLDGRPIYFFKFQELLHYDLAHFLYTVTIWYKSLSQPRYPKCQLSQFSHHFSSLFTASLHSLPLINWL